MIYMKCMVSSRGDKQPPKENICSLKNRIRQLFLEVWLSKDKGLPKIKKITHKLVIFNKVYELSGAG